MILDVTLLTYGEDSHPDSWFGDVIAFAPGSLMLPANQDVGVFTQHDTGKVAAGRALSVWCEPDGRVRATVELADTATGLDLAHELALNLRRDISVGVYLEEHTEAPLDPARAGDPWAPARATVLSADLAEITFCLRGRMPSAQVDTPAPAPPAEGNAP